MDCEEKLLVQARYRYLLTPMLVQAQLLLFFNQADSFLRDTMLRSDEWGEGAVSEFCSNSDIVERSAVPLVSLKVSTDKITFGLRFAKQDWASFDRVQARLALKLTWK